MVNKIMLRESIVGKISPKGQKAFSLLEVLIAIAILGIFVVVLVGGLTTASKSLILNDTRQTAKNLAETQMEFIKKAPYAFVYTPPSPPDSSYSSNITVETLPGKGANIQKVTIVITRGGNTAYTLADYKGN
jgi:prepilin-type N-terminal cleavage/methylation domain-containing protein